MVKSSSPFGWQARTRVLLALTLLSDRDPRELSRVLQLPLSGVQRALQSLDGLVAGRRRLAEPEAGRQRHVMSLRRRPAPTAGPPVTGARGARR